jgi:hypothetical protein
MSSQRFYTIVVLLLWLAFGPIGMAFDGCAAMGGMCGNPCALTSGTLPTPYNLLALLPLSDLHIKSPDYHPTTILKIPDPPPRFIPIAA